MFSYTIGPLVRGSRAIPADFATSFSGISPTDRRTVSQSKVISVPGMGLRFSSTLEMVTLSTLGLPVILVMVWDK